MKSLALLSISTLIACSSSEPIAEQPDGSVGCELEPQIERTRFEAESVTYLRAAFGVTAGFEGGTTSYGETMVPLDDSQCPIADWTGLSYTVAVTPAQVPIELRGSYDRVSAFWSMNGRKAVVFLPSDVPQNELDAWMYGRLPDNVNAVVRQGADADDVRDAVEQLRALRPALAVEHLDAVGVVTVTTAIGNFADDVVGAATVPEMEAAAAILRSNAVFESLDWSGVVLRYPNESWPAKVLDSDMLAPECERVHTREQREQGMFTTSPAFAAPLGAGAQDRTPTCE